MNPAEQFRTSPHVKEINALFGDIANGLEKNAALHRATKIGIQSSGDERQRLMDTVYAELKNHG